MFSAMNVASQSVDNENSSTFLTRAKMLQLILLPNFTLLISRYTSRATHLSRYLNVFFSKSRQSNEQKIISVTLSIRDFPHSLEKRFSTVNLFFDFRHHTQKN